MNVLGSAFWEKAPSMASFRSSWLSSRTQRAFDAWKTVVRIKLRGLALFEKAYRDDFEQIRLRVCHEPNPGMFVKFGTALGTLSVLDTRTKGVEHTCIRHNCFLEQKAS